MCLVTALHIMLLSLPACQASVPEPGIHAVGTVNKVGQDFLGLLILGAFNAVIKQKDMRTHFQHDKAVRPHLLLTCRMATPWLCSALTAGVLSGAE